MFCFVFVCLFFFSSGNQFPLENVNIGGFADFKLHAQLFDPHGESYLRSPLQHHSTGNQHIQTHSGLKYCCKDGESCRNEFNNVDRLWQNKACATVTIKFKFKQTTASLDKHVIEQVWMTIKFALPTEMKVLLKVSLMHTAKTKLRTEKM